MEDDLNLFEKGRPPNFFKKNEDDLKKIQIEDDLKKLKQYHFENRRRS